MLIGCRGLTRLLRLAQSAAVWLSACRRVGLGVPGRHNKSPLPHGSSPLPLTRWGLFFVLTPKDRMRYSARWSNGFWKMFDHVRFTDVQNFPRQVDAQATVKSRNAQVSR